MVVGGRSALDSVYWFRAARTLVLYFVAPLFWLYDASQSMMPAKLALALPVDTRPDRDAGATKSAAFDTSLVAGRPTMILGPAMAVHLLKASVNEPAPAAVL